MTSFGYTMMTEQSRPDQLVADIVAAEAAGFEFSARSDHFQRAHAQFRWLGLGWKVNADRPNPESFDAATAFVTPEQVGEQLGCGPDVEEHVEKIRPFIDAGFTEIALVQISGEHQASFINWAQATLLPALRTL